MAKDNSGDKRNKELLELGKKLQNFYDMGYINKRSALAFSFLKGLVTGAGAFIGGTLVVALVLWLLSLFSDAPIIGGIVQSVQDSLKK